MNPYTGLPGLEEIVLEESWVISVLARPARLEFVVEFVLTREHPGYAAPAAEEYECFRRGTMVFSEVTRLVWDGQGLPAAHDSTGEIDYGHIDVFEWERNRYMLTGDFGSIDVLASDPVVKLESRPTA
jgi:hypothetical protein